MAAVDCAPIGTSGGFSRGKVHSSFYDLHMTNTNMSTEPSVFYGQIQEILGSYLFGIPLADWSVLVRSCWLKFKRSLPSQSLGVKNLEELNDKLGKLMVVFEHYNKKKWVLSALVVERRLNKDLKPHVQELLRHYGEIKFDAFEDVYKENFYCKPAYSFYGLSNRDHLCEVLEDILEVGVDCSGEKVMKPAMSARAVETRLNDCLKPDVQELLRHSGEIKFDSFEDVYKQCFGFKLGYYFYGLTNLADLCEVFKDILEVGVDGSGDKVIKPVKRYNLRKRKTWM